MNHRGITLIELLLSVAIFATIAAVAFPISSNLLITHYHKNTLYELLSALGTAQINSMSKKAAGAWGVSTAGGKITLFRGTSYASRTTAFDQTYTIPNGVTVTSTEVTFDTLVGAPLTTPTITMQSSRGTNTITLTQGGAVNVL